MIHILIWKNSDNFSIKIDLIILSILAYFLGQFLRLLSKKNISCLLSLLNPPVLLFLFLLWTENLISFNEKLNGWKPSYPLIYLCLPVHNSFFHTAMEHLPMLLTSWSSSLFYRIYFLIILHFHLALIQSIC